MTMTTDSFFALMCMSLFAFLFGSALAFCGYRFFLVLLPILGFFFGFGFGAQTIQAIFGTGFLSDVTSWVVGFFVALLFAGLSYFFYFFAVALLAGSLGYSIGAGIMLAITPELNFLVWLIGIVVGVALAIVVIVFNVQKWVIIIATALMGAGVIVGTFLFMLGQLPSAEVVVNPVRAVLQDSPFWMIIFIVVAVLGIIVQFATSRFWQIESYNRWDEVDSSTAPVAPM
jgi:hypothetical protein